MTLREELIRAAERNPYITPSQAWDAFDKAFPVSSRIKGMGVPVATVLMQLVRDNVLHQAYKVMLPSGYLSYDDWVDPRDIPDWYSVYPTNAMEVVPVFYLNVCYRGNNGIQL